MMRNKGHYQNKCIYFSLSLPFQFVDQKVNNPREKLSDGTSVFLQLLPPHPHHTRAFTRVCRRVPPPCAFLRAQAAPVEGMGSPSRLRQLYSPHTCIYRHTFWCGH